MNLQIPSDRVLSANPILNTTCHLSHCCTELDVVAALFKYILFKIFAINNLQSVDGQYCSRYRQTRVISYINSLHLLRTILPFTISTPGRR